MIRFALILILVAGMGAPNSRLFAISDGTSVASCGDLAADEGVALEALTVLRDLSTKTGFLVSVAASSLDSLNLAPGKPGWQVLSTAFPLAAEKNRVTALTLSRLFFEMGRNGASPHVPKEAKRLGLRIPVYLEIKEKVKTLISNPRPWMRALEELWVENGYRFAHKIEKQYGLLSRLYRYELSAGFRPLLYGIQDALEYEDVPALFEFWTRVSLTEWPQDQLEKYRLAAIRTGRQSLVGSIVVQQAALRRAEADREDRVLELAREELEAELSRQMAWRHLRETRDTAKYLGERLERLRKKRARLVTLLSAQSSVASDREVSAEAFVGVPQDRIDLLAEYEKKQNLLMRLKKRLAGKTAGSARSRRMMTEDSLRERLSRLDRLSSTDTPDEEAIRQYILFNNGVSRHPVDVVTLAEGVLDICLGWEKSNSDEDLVIVQAVVNALREYAYPLPAEKIQDLYEKVVRVYDQYEDPRDDSDLISMEYYLGAVDWLRILRKNPQRFYPAKLTTFERKVVERGLKYALDFLPEATDTSEVDVFLEGFAGYEVDENDYLWMAEILLETTWPDNMQDSDTAALMESIVKIAAERPKGFSRENALKLATLVDSYNVEENLKKKATRERVWSYISQMRDAAIARFEAQKNQSQPPKRVIVGVFPDDRVSKAEALERQIAEVTALMESMREDVAQVRDSQEKFAGRTISEWWEEEKLARRDLRLALQAVIALEPGSPNPEESFKNVAKALRYLRRVVPAERWVRIFTTHVLRQLAQVKHADGPGQMRNLIAEALQNFALGSEDQAQLVTGVVQLAGASLGPGYYGIYAITNADAVTLIQETMAAVFRLPLGLPAPEVSLLRQSLRTFQKTCYGSAADSSYLTALIVDSRWTKLARRSMDRTQVILRGTDTQISAAEDEISSLQSEGEAP